tara:strand:- start:161 stop:358 length:198 start_codon:yes stop_codon:yes gene_type:complete
MPKEITLKTMLDELNLIVKKMEEGNVELEEMIELYEKGSSLCRDCKKTIDVAEKKINMIQNGVEG